MDDSFSPVNSGFVCGEPWITHDDIFIANVCNKKTKNQSFSFCLYIEISKVSDGPSLVFCIINIPYFVRSV